MGTGSQSLEAEKDLTALDSQSTALLHGNLDTSNVATDASEQTVEGDTSISSNESTTLSNVFEASKSQDSLSSVDPQDTHRKDDPMHAVIQEVLSQSQEGLLLLREVQRAREQNLPTGKVWDCLYSVAEKNGFESSCVFPNVVHLYLTAGFLVSSEDIPFLLGLLAWYVQNYGKNGNTKPNNFLPDDNPYLYSARALLIKELEKRLSPVARIQDLIKSYRDPEEIMNARSLFERVFELILKTCNALESLVSSRILHLSDVWPLLGNNVFLHQLDESYQGRLDTGMETMKSFEEFSLKIREDCFGDEVWYPPLVPKFQSYQQLFGTGISVGDPLHVWILWIHLSTAGDLAGLAIPYLEKHKCLALAYPCLRPPILALLKTYFGRTILGFKFSVLYFAAKVLGPHFGQDFAFFEQACIFLRTHAESYADSVTELLKQLILPAITMCENSEDAASLAWDVLLRIDSQTRSQLYTEWLTDSYNSMPALKAATTLLQDDISALMPQLTFESMEESVGDSLLELVTRCPLVAWRYILQYTLKNKGIVPVLVKLIVSDCDEFAQDTLMFMIYNILDEKCRLRFDDEVHLEEWFASLSSLIGRLFAQSRYLQVSALVTYLEFLAKRISTSAACVQLFQDLLAWMSGIKPLIGLSDREVAALSGSTVLKREVLLPTTEVTLPSQSTLDQPPNDEATIDREEYAGLLSVTNGALPSSIKALFAALHPNNLCVKILKILHNQLVSHDVPLLNNRHFVQTSFFVFSQFLFVVNLIDADTDADVLGIISDIALLSEQCGDASLLAFVQLKRKTLRSQIDAHCLDFVSDVAQRFDAYGVDPIFYALFWTLEAYDVYVPESDYIREIERIESLGQSDQSKRSAPEVEAARMRLLDSLKASHATHRAHVAWILSRLPKLKVSDTGNFLRAAITRSFLSEQDAHFAFCFITRTVKDPVYLLKTLFDRRNLMRFFSAGEHELGGIFRLLREFWHDLRSWPSQKASQDSGAQNLVNAEGSSPNFSMDSCTTCTLFRQGMEVDRLVQYCEEETMSAVSAALNSHLAVKNALRGLVRLADFVPHRHDLRYAFVHVQLRALARANKDPEGDALVENVIEIYKKQEEDTNAFGIASDEEDAPFHARKQRKTDVKVQKTHEKGEKSSSERIL